MAGKPVAWAKGLQAQRLIRVHMQAANGLTACRALNTATSPYIGAGGHVAYATTAALTCQPCKRVAPALAKVAKAPAKAKATPATTPIVVAVQAPVTPNA